MNIWAINIRYISQEKLELLHDEFCKIENRNKDTLPNVEYTYHDIYAEMIRREKEESQD
jgi:hypothetical protein